ncbi:TPA: hypothetical protein ACU21B_000710 [Mannheimia haemolytica]
MNNTLRLVFPQWQGAAFGIMPVLVPELDYQDARYYVAVAQRFSFLFLLHFSYLL